jgi:hypothetical protein
MLLAPHAMLQVLLSLFIIQPNDIFSRLITDLSFTTARLFSSGSFQSLFIIFIISVRKFDGREDVLRDVI